jgi:hypothetical protein
VYQDSVYKMFLKAIHEKQQIICNYQGLHREVCPHILGRGKHHETKALVYQFAGRSSKGLPPEGEWRCLTLSEVRDAQLRTGNWHTGNRHTRPQTCVKVIEAEVTL